MFPNNNYVHKVLYHCLSALPCIPWSLLQLHKAQEPRNHHHTSGTTQLGGVARCVKLTSKVQNPTISIDISSRCYIVGPELRMLTILGH